MCLCCDAEIQINGACGGRWTRNLRATLPIYKTYFFPEQQRACLSRFVLYLQPKIQQQCSVVSPTFTWRHYVKVIAQSEGIDSASTFYKICSHIDSYIV